MWDDSKFSKPRRDSGGSRTHKSEENSSLKE